MLPILILSSCVSSSEKDKHLKIFRYNQAEGLSSLDPAFARNQANIWAVNQLYNGLVELNLKLEIVPCIARSWQISEDGLYYTFFLRDDVYFHDSEVFSGSPAGSPSSIKGRNVTAKDFVYSFKRIIDPVTASTGAWIFNDKVLRNESGEIEDTCFKATDNYTLKIYLQNPFPPFLEILAMPYAYVVPKEAIDRYGKDFRTNPVGSGPFIFNTWDEGTTMAFLKNQYYWRKVLKTQNSKLKTRNPKSHPTGDQPKAGNIQLPYLDAVQVSFIRDNTQAFFTFQQQKLDFLSWSEDFPKDLILNADGSVQEEFADKFRFQKAPYLHTQYLGFQLDEKFYPDKIGTGGEGRKHPLLDKRVRQALSYAINRKELITYLRYNIGISGTSGIVPAALPSFDADKVKGYDYMPDLAQQLLKQAGYPQGQGFELKLYTNAPYMLIAEYLQKQWAGIGVKVSIDVNPFATHQEMVDNGRIKFFRASWLGDYPDAENYLAMFYSKNFAPAGPNKTHFKNEQFDKLYEQAQLENDTKKRYELYQQMDQIVMDEAPVIVLYYDEVVRLTQNYVSGLEVDAMNMLKLERVDFVK
ncbi:MAG: ABC transporter substrate-binding protein [Cytophagales bacterium]|nr:ABC transporter substrate-binding protein [Cytophagales bacterium]